MNETKKSNQKPNIYNTHGIDLTYSAWCVNASKDITSGSWANIKAAYSDYKQQFIWD